MGITGPMWQIAAVEVSTPLATINIGHLWIDDFNNEEAPIYADRKDIRMAYQIGPESPLDVRCKECDNHTQIRYNKDRTVVYVVVGHQVGCQFMLGILRRVT